MTPAPADRFGFAALAAAIHWTRVRLILRRHPLSPLEIRCIGRAVRFHLAAARERPGPRLPR